MFEEHSEHLPKATDY